MKRKYYVRALAIGAAVTAMAGVGGGAYAVTSAVGISPVNVTGPDHQRLTVTLAPGASQAFRLPAANDPVRIDLDKVSTNGGIQTPSEVFSALVNVDGNGAGMSWIGTSSDGSQLAGSTATGTSITSLVCGSQCVIATLSASSAAAHTVVLQANAATSSIKEKYVVNIWY
ncbi:MAG: hypothetical protein JOY82_04015 [Streptosporangiaceae bacterium]|nr:hypothetical protein [Streptosporangiaceae bacterium]MBV9853678.1 hypothetical protein [Streptosporangiaceae bacterium]